MVNEKMRLGVLHGAISNAGDFLIYERGKRLLGIFLKDKFNFTYIKRFKHINGNFNGLIILGGPFFMPKIRHEYQTQNIIEYIKKRDIPVFCMGLGITGGKFKSETDYFLDNESILFWKYIYETSKLFSVRDKIAYNMLNNYGIKAELTGCPALFNLEILEKNKVLAKNEKNNKIAVTIPYLSIGPFLSIRPFSSVKSLLLTLYFLFLLKRKFNKKELGLIFQHGYPNVATKIMQKIANMIGIKTYDASGKSLDSFSELREYDAHIGTRLHSHIFFLSSNKPSFLFNVDMRTEAFLKTIETPSDKYTISGIRNLVNMLAERIAENNFDEFNNVPNEIRSFYVIMKNFLNKIDLFYSRGN
ncbi:MAG: polysaccharide pyruvyl transferase family protein [Methanophagales archaeon]|nr:polysaccharide pyruvyl transferase family protein [Methanophagales archaeon]